MGRSAGGGLNAKPPTSVSPAPIDTSGVGLPLAASCAGVNFSMTSEPVLLTHRLPPLSNAM